MFQSNRKNTGSQCGIVCSLYLILFLNALCQQRTNLSSSTPRATSVLFSISSLCGRITVRVTLGPI